MNIMKTQIDVKSTLAGLVIGILATLAVGAGTSSNPVGKYAIGTSMTPWGCISCVLDTQTGEVWGMDVKTDWHDYKPEKFFGPK